MIFQGNCVESAGFSAGRLTSAQVALEGKSFSSAAEHSSERTGSYATAALHAEAIVDLPGSAVLILEYGVHRAGFQAFRLFTLPAESNGVKSGEEFQLYSYGRC